MKTLLKIFITCIVVFIFSKSSISNNMAIANTYMIVDSIEIQKQQVKDFYTVVSSNAYIPVNFIDKNLIENLKAFSNVMNTCRQVEKEIEDEKNKSFIIFDAPVREKKTSDKDVPIG